MVQNLRDHHFQEDIRHCCAHCASHSNDQPEDHSELSASPDDRTTIILFPSSECSLHNCALASFYGNLLGEDTNLKLDVSSFSIVTVYITVLAPNEGDDDQPNIRPHL